MGCAWRGSLKGEGHKFCDVIEWNGSRNQSSSFQLSQVSQKSPGNITCWWGPSNGLCFVEGGRADLLGGLHALSGSNSVWEHAGAGSEKTKKNQQR